MQTTMILLKTDWQFISDKRYNNIRDDSFSIIYSNEGDYHTARKVFRCREMYELMELLLILESKGEDISSVLSDIKNLKREIDK